MMHSLNNYTDMTPRLRPNTRMTFAEMETNVRQGALRNTSGLNRSSKVVTAKEFGKMAWDGQFSSLIGVKQLVVTGTKAHLAETKNDENKLWKATKPPYVLKTSAQKSNERARITRLLQHDLDALQLPPEYVTRFWRLRLQVIDGVALVEKETLADLAEYQDMHQRIRPFNPTSQQSRSLHAKTQSLDLDSDSDEDELQRAIRESARDSVSGGAPAPHRSPYAAANSSPSSADTRGGSKVAVDIVLIEDDSQPQSPSQDGGVDAIDEPTHVVVLDDSQSQNEDSVLQIDLTEESESQEIDAAATWACTVCTFANSEDEDICRQCDARLCNFCTHGCRTVVPKDATKCIKCHAWLCEFCTTMNSRDSPKCTSCASETPSKGKGKGKWVLNDEAEENNHKDEDVLSCSNGMHSSDTWKCASCTYENESSDARCQMCDAPNPGGESANSGVVYKDRSDGGGGGGGGGGDSYRPAPAGRDTYSDRGRTRGRDSQGYGRDRGSGGGSRSGAGGYDTAIHNAASPHQHHDVKRERVADQLQAVRAEQASRYARRSSSTGGAGPAFTHSPSPQRAASSSGKQRRQDWPEDIEDDPYASDGQMEAMRAANRQSKKRSANADRPDRSANKRPRQTKCGNCKGIGHNRASKNCPNYDSEAETAIRSATVVILLDLHFSVVGTCFWAQPGLLTSSFLSDVCVCASGTWLSL